jgi:hypothetical protein
MVSRSECHTCGVGDGGAGGDDQRHGRRAARAPLGGSTIQVVMESCNSTCINGSSKPLAEERGYRWGGGGAACGWYGSYNCHIWQWSYEAEAERTQIRATVHLDRHPGSTSRLSPSPAWIPAVEADTAHDALRILRCSIAPAGHPAPASRSQLRISHQWHGVRSCPSQRRASQMVTVADIENVDGGCCDVALESSRR